MAAKRNVKKKFVRYSGRGSASEPLRGGGGGAVTTLSFCVGSSVLGNLRRSFLFFFFINGDM